MDASRLIEAWCERDARYATRWIAGRPAPLTLAESTAIEMSRIREAMTLPAGPERCAALAYIEDWTRCPPAVEGPDPLRGLDHDNVRHRARWHGRRTDAHPVS